MGDRRYDHEDRYRYEDRYELPEQYRGPDHSGLPERSRDGNRYRPVDYEDRYGRGRELYSQGRKPKGKAGTVFVLLLEVGAVVASFLASSSIARFLTAKITMDVVVEVTARFGKEAGHALSNVLAMIVAEPRIIAVIVAGFILFLNFIVWLIRKLASLR